MEGDDWWVGGPTTSVECVGSCYGILIVWVGLTARGSDQELL